MDSPAELETEVDPPHRAALGREELRRSPVLLAISIALAIALLSLAFWRLPATDPLTPFVVPLLLDALQIALIAVGLIAGIQCLLGRGGTAALLISAAGLLAYRCVPLEELWMQCDFAWKRSAREAVVERIARGEWSSRRSDGIYDFGREVLPVSIGGNNRVLVEMHPEGPYVFFFYYEGLLGNCFGLLHVPEGGDPHRFGERAASASVHIARQVDARWYRVRLRDD